jgi:hypothetical protein
MEQRTYSSAGCIPVAFLFLISVIGGCDRDNGSHFYTFQGKVQKGPFVAGAQVTLNELNEGMGQTGKAFTTAILSDDGSFELHNIELGSDLALITASGFYYSELYNELSGAPLTLQAVVDLTDKELVNINVMTHLVRGRIEKLMEEGADFAGAYEQARSELLDFLGISDHPEDEFEDLDISEDSESNAILLSTSVILQRYTLWSNEKSGLTAELTYLLASLGTDLSDNGIIDRKELIDTILHNIAQLELLDIREHLESRYAELGIQAAIPPFESFIGKFQEKHSAYLYDDFTYPDFASPEPRFAPEAVLPNLLVKEDTVFAGGEPYTIAAIIPLECNLTIKFISGGSGDQYLVSGPIIGWRIEHEVPNGFTLHSQRRNSLMAGLFYLQNPGQANIEYYENEATSPTFTKTIRWE